MHLQTGIRTYIGVHGGSGTHRWTYVLIYMHARVENYLQVGIRTHNHTHINKYLQTDIPTYAHTYIHICIHILIFSLIFSRSFHSYFRDQKSEINVIFSSLSSFYSFRYERKEGKGEYIINVSRINSRWQPLARSCHGNSRRCCHIKRSYQCPFLVEKWIHSSIYTFPKHFNWVSNNSFW